MSKLTCENCIMFTHCRYDLNGNGKLCEHFIDEANVILPPCKVGDKVYRIAKDGKTIVEERIGEMHLEFTIEDGTGWHNTWWLKDYNIGVTTFLTKEEAEKVVKELNYNAQA